MNDLPIMVETKKITITDSIATANDRLTGEPCIIAFRATVSKIGKSENAKFQFNSPGKRLN